MSGRLEMRALDQLTGVRVVVKGMIELKEAEEDVGGSVP